MALRTVRSHLAHLNRSPIVPLGMYSVVSAVVLSLMGPPILILIVPFAIAFVLWFVWFRDRAIHPTTAFLQLYIVMYVAQLAHLIEEWNTGFYNSFPALWGSVFFDDPGRFPAWSPIVFVTGNLLMDGFWEVAILLFARRNAWANYTVWLFLNGMVVNAVGHPLYSLWLLTHPSLQEFLGTTYGYTSTWYFPGLFTSFVLAAVVTQMIRELRRNYRDEAAPYPALGDALGTAS
jgi:hypothetical protein